MATATYTPTTGGSDLKELGKKVQAGVYKAAQWGVEEWQWFGNLEKFDVALGQREITAELDIIEGTGATFITEGGKEARPSSPTAVTATIPFLLLNKRWTISRTTYLILQRQGTRAFLENQFKWQGRKAVDAIRKKIGDGFYGFSTGTVAKVSSTSTDDIVLKDLYGISGLGATTHNRQVVDLFTAGTAPNQDFIACLNPSGPALRTGGIVGLDSKTRSTNTVTGASVSDITSLTADDLIVFANSLENTTMASGTERNLNLVGLLDGLTSTTVHSVSGSTYENWNAGIANTTGGQFTPVSLMKFRQAIMNEGGGELNLLIVPNGVKNNMVSQVIAGVRYDGMGNLEFDGDPKAKGIKIVTSRRVPDSYVFGFDKNNSVRKLALFPEIDLPGMDEGDKLQDDSGYVFSTDFIVQMVWTNRANAGYFSALTQS